jgi:iron complex outermembrane receptor protein
MAFAQTTVFDLGQVVVSEDEDTQERLTIEEKAKISQKTLKSHKVVDLAEILSDELIEASMVRKSGYGNEVGLRGFTKSNLRFTLDDTLIEGSCGSRKDPPLSHINMLTVKSLEVKEGPYDVSVPGALGGDINVISKDTQKGMHGEVLSKFGSFGYLSQGGYVTGGSDSLQGLFGYNYSESGQYKDGAGNKLSSFNPAYNDEGKNMDAFKKNDFWGKVSVKPAENQNLLFSYSYGEASDIMTPRVAMDTEKEKTYLNKVEYIINDLSSISGQLKLSAYYNRVEHYPYGKLLFLIGMGSYIIISLIEIERLKKIGVIKNFSATINLGSLGLTTYTMLLRFEIYEKNTRELYLEISRISEYLKFIYIQMMLLLEFIGLLKK